MRTYAPPPAPPRPPLYDPTELPGVVNANPKDPVRAHEILARLLDASEFVPYRERYGPTIVCGTGAIGGYPVGVLINDGVLFSESSQKAANFIELCSQTGLPLLFLHNISGFMVGQEYEAGGIGSPSSASSSAAATARATSPCVVAPSARA